MMDQIQHEGLWWDAREPDQRWTGTLRFDERAGVSLSLFVPLEKPELSPPLRRYDLILGLAPNGERFTLIDCFDQSARGSVSGGLRVVNVSANALVVGVHCDQADPMLSAVSVSFGNANHWCGRSGIVHDPTVAFPDFSARYKSIEPSLLYVDGELRIALQSRVEASVGNYQASMREAISFEIEAAEPRSLSEFQRLVGACRDFLSIACLTYCGIEHFSFVVSVEDGGPRSIGTLHAIPFYGNPEARSSVVVRMLFGWPEIESRAQALFSAWLSKADELHDARALYVSGVYGHGFLEHKLLALTQAAEAYHRRFFRDRYMDDADFESQVFWPMAAAIPPTADASLRTAILARLKFANEYSLRRRLHELFREYAIVLRLLAPKPEEYISPILDTRNEFTHFPVPASETPVATTRARADQVLLYNWLLRLLLESCFLTAMGFSTDEIVSFVQRSETYRQLAVRFRDEAGKGVRTRA